MSDENLVPESLDDLVSILESHPKVLAVGNQTKPPLSCSEDARHVSLRAMTGIIEYEPSEFTFTAKAGTRIEEIESALAERRQYLPFDPMLVNAGATLGGTVASGLSGPGRFRFGGIRDFLLGVRFVSGDAKVIHAGGKVVKNAAGFDIPKLLVGSMGRLGAMAELTFKVFPKPVSTVTLAVQCETSKEAADRIAMAASSRWELDAIDYRAQQHSIFLRLGGPPEVNDAIASEICSLWGECTKTVENADEFWRSVRELNWKGDSPIAVKVPATSVRWIDSLESIVASAEPQIHCSVAGNVFWILLDDQQQLHKLDLGLQQLKLPGLVLRGSKSGPRIGQWSTSEMESAIKSAMDPPARFPGF